MTFTPFFHGTFTLRRTWNAPAQRVFEAWADPRVKAQWFTGPPDRWTLSRREMWTFAWAAGRCWKGVSTRAAWCRASMRAIT